MKRALLSGVLLGVALCAAAKTPPTASVDRRPISTQETVRPQTQVAVFQPRTLVSVNQPQTQVTVVYPQTRVTVAHPTTQVVEFHATTPPGEVVHPITTVSVIHPQTTGAVFHPQTQEEVVSTQPATGAMTGGKSLSRSTATTSMSDFKPKQAKNFSAPVADKAAATGGESLNLGNTTNQAEKDNANKSSQLGLQNNQNMEIDPKQTQLKGLEKALTDRAKLQQKKN